MRKLALILWFLFLASTPTFALVATINEVEYLSGDDILIDGIVDTSTNPTLVIANFYNSSGALVANHSAISVGGSNNIFTMVIRPTEYANLTIPGDYVVNISDGNEEISLSFKVVKDKLFFIAHLIDSPDVKVVNTNNTVNLSSTPIKEGHNFSELIGLSRSNILHYGTINLPTGKNLTFVLVDNNFPGVYETVYIDNSANFSKIWKIRRVGEKISEDINYVVAEIEYSTGDKLILVPPIDDSIYSSGETVYFVGFIENSTNHLKGNQSVNLSLVDKKGNTIATKNATTTKEGYFVANFTAPSDTGKYFIKINNTPAEVFSVENFKLFATVTDLSGTPRYSFAPNPKIKIVATVKDLAGEPINGAIVNATIIYPDGTLSSLLLTGGNGTYSKELDLKGKPLGKYKVNLVATYSNNKQETFTGFEIEAIGLEIMAINPRFIEEAEGPEAMVDAFAPGTKVSIAVILSNISEGGLMARGPEAAGLIDIESDGKNCSERVTILEIKDENDNELDLSSLNITIVNISKAMEILNGSDEGPPKNMRKQCMVIFDAPDRKGIYKIKIKVDHPLGKKEGGTRFGIQRLYARANPVDFKGDDFWFYAPNETIRIKLKITDLKTREELDASSITDAKILEMYRLWPSFEDVFTETYREMANETMVNGTLQFVSPSMEGFFMMKFKFRANLSEGEEEGTGLGFFMLKKYMIWGEPMCEMEHCVFGSGENITLNIHVVDIDKASLLDLGKSQLSCTGCDGLLVEVGELWNDQLMRKMEEGVNYNATTDSVYNSTATIKIIPLDLPAGWYHVDLKLTDLSTNDTYFGWAWFEIRNFWVDTMPLTEKNGTLSVSKEMGMAYGVNDSVLFGVLAYAPENPEQLPILNATLETLNLFSMGPPITLEEKKDYNCNIEVSEVLKEAGPGEYHPVNMTVINITGLKRTGRYDANVKVKTPKGTDIGTYWFQVAPFITNLTYPGKDQWPVIFSIDETVEINVSAYGFDNSPRELNENLTKVTTFWNEKIGEPMKPPENSTQVNCISNNCTILVNLSRIISRPGRYSLEIRVVDTQENEKEERIFFEAKSFLIAVPSIKEIWVDHILDTPKRELNLKDSKDRCHNHLILPGYCDFNEITNISNCTVEIDGKQYKLNTSSVFNASGSGKAGVYCISEEGEWHEGYCSKEKGINISIVSNGTHLAYNTSCGYSCMVSGNYTIGDTFNAGEITWVILNITKDGFEIKNAFGICGVKEELNSPPTLYTLVPPNNSDNFSNYYFGYIRNLIGRLEWGDPWFETEYAQFNESRDVYMYHNTTHLWVSDTPNFSSVQGVPVGGVIKDPYGGNWEVLKLDNNNVVLYGQNVLAETGAFVNTSLSKSGVFKLAAVNEEWLGYWDPNTGQNIGIDINGDNKTNTTLYFMISDSQKEGIYDTLFYSNNNNFSTPKSVNGNRSERTFGSGENLTLLSISPDARSIRAYSEKIGDWSDLGELKIGNLVKIPVIVRSPSGEPINATVSLELIRVESVFGVQEIKPVNEFETNITGIGEILVNLSEALNSSVQAGRYTFGIKAVAKNDKEIMEEWRWPFAEIRAFLVDTSVGEGGYITGFNKLPIAIYREENYGFFPQLENISAWGKVYDGVIMHKITNGSDECSNFSEPSDAAPGYNWTLELNYGYYAYINAGNESKVWIKQGDCNFSSVQAKSEGDQINLTINNHVYMVYILEVNTSSTDHGVIIGLAGFNSDTIKPIKAELNAVWKIIGINLSGTYYDVVLAGNDSVDYPMCTVWGLDECAKVAWFDTDGNFSDAIPAKIGDNFTSDLYLASIGPGPWDGLAIGNFSETNITPGIGIWISEDSNTTWFAQVNEAEINLDLDRDGVKNKTFYILTFDDYKDDKAKPTQNIVDDDLHITEEWWSNFHWENPSYYDFYGNETGIIETRSGLPTAIWNGNIRFGEENENMSWNEKPNWDVFMYNNTSMLIWKWREWWENGFNKTENITIKIRVYNFDQTPILNANVSVEKIMHFTPFSAEFLDQSEYAVIGSNKTDSDGYAIIILVPNGTWEEGDYTVKIRIDSSGVSDAKKEWFRVGDSEW